MGDETRQITRDLESTIRSMAGQVGEIHGWRGSVDKRLDCMDKKLTKQNGRIDDLETFEDETKASKKTTAKWVKITLIVIGLGLSAFKMWGCASPCAPGYDPPIKTDSVTITRIDTLCSIDTLE